MLFVFVSLKHSHYRVILIHLSLIAVTTAWLPTLAQTHTFGISVGVQQTLPFGKLTEPSGLPPFQSSFTFPRPTFSLLYRNLPHQIGIETGLILSSSSVLVRQTLTNGGQYSVRTTLTPHYQLISLPLQVIIVPHQLSESYYRKWNWLLVIGPKLNLIKGTGLRSETIFQGQGLIQSKLANTFAFDTYIRAGVNAGIRLQPNSQRKQKVQYSLNWTSIFNGIRPWQATLTMNGQSQLIQVVNQPLHTINLNVEYCISAH